MRTRKFHYNKESSSPKDPLKRGLKGAPPPVPLSRGFKGARSAPLDYFQVTLNTLKSLISDNRVKRLISLLLIELSSISSRQQKFACQRTYISIVSWPIVAEGIMRQLQVDLPRQHVFINGVPWVYHEERNNALSFCAQLEAQVGSSIWARWICAFVNQAPAADLLLRVSQDAQAQFGQNVFLRDHHTPLEIQITCSKSKNDSSKITPSSSSSSSSIAINNNQLSVSFSKSFQVVQFLGNGELNLDKQIFVDTEMTIEFLPIGQVSLFWKYRERGTGAPL
jgi:hypothetical protein